MVRQKHHIKEKDKNLFQVIDQVGHIYREVDTDIFSSVIHHIIGQQILTKAQLTIWQRMQDKLGEVNAETILKSNNNDLQSIGLTFRKVGVH